MYYFCYFFTSFYVNEILMQDCENWFIDELILILNTSHCLFLVEENQYGKARLCQSKNNEKKYD